MSAKNKITKKKKGNGFPETLGNTKHHSTILDAADGRHSAVRE